MKIKKFTIELKVQPKARQHFAPLTKKFKNKKQYNRRDFKLAFAWTFIHNHRMTNKKYIIIDTATGRASRLDNAEFNDAITGLDCVSDHFNTWVCESYIVLELPI